jgi:hypothetical protein
MGQPQTVTSQSLTKISLWPAACDYQAQQGAELRMSEAVPNTHNEFWRPPLIAEPCDALEAAITPAVDACPRCGAEFMVAARFCYACGCARPGIRLEQSWTGYLEFHNIKRGALVVKQALGLPLPSMVCFLLGVFCLLSAIAVGFIAPADTLADFQAIQLWRMEWLLGGVAVFVAGILLRRSSPPQK